MSYFIILIRAYRLSTITMKRPSKQQLLSKLDSEGPGSVGKIAQSSSSLPDVLTSMITSRVNRQLFAGPSDLKRTRR